MLKGIDTQVAFQRVNEMNTKDLSAQLKRPEIVHDQAVQIGNAQAQREASQVAMLEQKDSVSIKNEDRRRREASEKKKKKNKNAQGIVVSPEGLDLDQIRRNGMDIEA